MSLKYRPEIDGLRALAILPVVLFHLGCSWIPGGFIGVDVFFVISGYLITGILLGDLDAGSFTFRGFWTRRVMRIFPALLAMIACTLVAAWLITPRTDHPAIGQQAVAALLSVANLWYWQFASNYWGSTAESSPMLHTWSLSLEEQFYLCLPPLLWAAFARGRRGAQAAIAAATISSGLLFALGVARSGFADVFYLLPTRAWELGIGACLATARPAGPAHQGSWRFVARDSLAVVGVALIVAMCLATPGRTRAAVGAVSGAALVIAFANRGACRVLLSQPLFVWIGKMSYSLYLWHWPVIVLSDFVRPAPSTVTKLLGFMILTAISYVCIENPTRRRMAWLPIIGVGYLATLALALSMAVSSGTYDTSMFETPTETCFLYDLGHLSDSIPLGNGEEQFGRASKDEALRSGGLVLGSASTPDIVVFGDSHGVMWCPAIRSIAEKLGVTVSLCCANGVSPFVAVPANRAIWDRNALTLTEKQTLDAGKLRAVQQWKPVVAIVCARWAGYNPADAETLLPQLSEHVDHILLVEQPPMLEVGNRLVMQWLCYESIYPVDATRQFLPAGDVVGSNRARELLGGLVAKYPKCSVVSIHDVFAAGPDQVLVLDGKNVVYSDDDHLSQYGVALAANRLETTLSKILKLCRQPAAD